MKKSHGIMFHHFYNEKHEKGQGAISAGDLERIILNYKNDFHIIPADEYLKKAINSKLNEDDVCMTFDDSLKSQIDVALPVLDKYGLTAFWFVYSSPLEGTAEKLEIYRHFRTVCFPDIDRFYDAFFELVSMKYPQAGERLLTFDIEKYFDGFGFYTARDKEFRALRDYIFTVEEYDNIMGKMLEDFEYDIRKAIEQLWLDKNDIKYLHNKGHIIGLHSHTHPMTMCELGMEMQRKEYAKNKEVLEGILKSKIVSVSYPCNSYNKETIQIIKELGIEVGFRANMQCGCYKMLDISREDHANIIKKLNSNSYTM